MRIYQKGFNYSQDGPGNRLVYHLQGCNFKCKWCSNPESMDFVGESTEYTIDELVKEATSSKAMFFDGGGVTLTGGEPTMQFEEVKELLEKLKENGINTAIENNGSHPKLSELPVDFLIMDFKHYDDEKHKFWTGCSNYAVKENIKRICKSRRQLLIRIPVVNGVNNNPLGFVEFFKEFDCSNVMFEFLQYHEYGKNKWKEAYEIIDGFVSNDDIKKFKMVFEQNNLKVTET